MPIKMIIKDEEIWVDSILITDEKITIAPSQGVNFSGTIQMDYTQFCDFRDRLITFSESVAAESGTLVVKE